MEDHGKLKLETLRSRVRPENVVGMGRKSQENHFSIGLHCKGEEMWDSAPILFNHVLFVPDGLIVG